MNDEQHMLIVKCAATCVTHAAVVCPTVTLVLNIGVKRKSVLYFSNISVLFKNQKNAFSYLTVKQWLVIPC
jgi:hypothetical protein